MDFDRKFKALNSRFALMIDDQVHSFIATIFSGNINNIMKENPNKTYFVFSDAPTNSVNKYVLSMSSTTPKRTIIISNFLVSFCKTIKKVQSNR